MLESLQNVKDAKLGGDSLLSSIHKAAEDHLEKKDEHH